MLAGFFEGQRTFKTKTAWEEITLRERDVLKLIGEGPRNKDIAELLCIGPKIVEKHRANIMNKLNVPNAAFLTAYAIEKGLVSK